MQEPTGLFIDGTWIDSSESADVLDKFTREPIRRVSVASQEHVAAAVAGAQFAARHPLSPASRSDILLRAADLLDDRADEIERDYVAETGFTIADARVERERAAQVFRLSAGEAIRLAGEEIPVAGTPGSENRLAFTVRVPVGVVAAITPFNAPLNTVAHKIGPAIAAGNAVVLKPASATPLGAIALARALTDAGLPAGLLQVTPGPGTTTGLALARDERVRFITFTGSSTVGQAIRRESGLARTHLELGANSASIVAADANLELVASLSARAGFRKAGQVCTSVQRLLVDRRVVDELADRLGTRVAGLRVGDPRAPETDVGPLISESAAKRAYDWIEASRGTETRVVGGERDGVLLQPTLVVSPRSDSKLLNDEVFAPVVSIVAVESVDEAIDLVNAGPYGLQAGVFTQDIDRAFAAARRLDVGGVMINDTSSYHADLMPYGGVKASGHGIEGPKYATRDMTDPRIIVLNLATDPEN